MRLGLNSTGFLAVALLGFSMACSSASKQSTASTPTTPSAEVAKEAPAAEPAKATKAEKKSSKAKAEKKEAPATTASSEGNQTTCTTGKETRTLKIEMTEEKGCKLMYSPKGDTPIATAHSSDAHCKEVRDRVKQKLEAAGYKCAAD